MCTGRIALMVVIVGSDGCMRPFNKRPCVRVCVRAAVVGSTDPLSAAAAVIAPLGRQARRKGAPVRALPG